VYPLDSPHLSVTDNIVDANPKVPRRGRSECTVTREPSHALHQGFVDVEFRPDLFSMGRALLGTAIVNTMLAIRLQALEAEAPVEIVEQFMRRRDKARPKPRKYRPREGGR
jgi:hypothetical protein